MTGLRVRIAGVFAPRERELFALLEAAASNALEAADQLEELAHFFPDRRDVIEAIARHARESDRLTAAIRAHVSATFVTAIEREDALTLSAALDDLVRGAHAVAALLAVYQVAAVRPQARRVTQLIAANAKALAAAIERLRDAGDVAAHSDEVRMHAEEGEDLARAGLAELFSEDPAPIELVRWKDLFERLQGALQASRHAAAAVDVIAAKQR